MVDMTLKKKKLDSIPNFLDVIAPKPADTLKLDTPNTPPKVPKKPVDKGKPIISVDKRLVGFEYGDGSIDLGAKNISNKPVPGISKEDAIRQQIADEQLKNQIRQEMTPPSLTTEQVNNIGQLNPDIINNPDAIGQSINQNVENKIKANTPLLYQEGDKVLPFVNKATSFVGSVSAFGISGRNVINALSTDRSTRDYLNDYSNEDNLRSIRKDIATSNQQISEAIQSAKFDENTPENVQKIQQIYNNAQSLKYKRIAQLQQIANNDQREYTDSIKDDLIELDRYFNGDKYLGIPPGKLIDDNALYSALNKPSPKYLPDTQGVQ